MLKEGRRTDCLILLIEDEESDAFIICRSLRGLEFNGTIHHVSSGEAALSYLASRPPYSDRSQFPLPDLIISDSAVSPQRPGGVEILEWLRSQPSLHKIPFVLFSGGLTPAMEQRASAAGANLILQKAADMKQTSAQLHEALLQLPVHCREWLR
jgi:CheY-like chemotaxis protein